MDYMLGDYSISTRLDNIFKINNINNILELTNLTEREISCWRNVGKKILKEIRDLLQHHGLCLKNESLSPIVEKMIFKHLPYCLDHLSNSINETKKEVEDLCNHLNKIEELIKKIKSEHSKSE